MANKIPMGNSIPMSSINPRLPNMTSALISWFVPMTFGVVTKITQAGQVIETTVPVSFRGVMQELTASRLILKPEGQRSWRWKWLHCDPSLKLKNDDVVIYNGVQYRVHAFKDYSEYGYLEYELHEDWTGAGPEQVTP